MLKEEERMVEEVKHPRIFRSKNNRKITCQSQIEVRSRSSNKSMKSEISMKSEERSDKLRRRLLSRKNLS